MPRKNTKKFISKAGEEQEKEFSNGWLNKFRWGESYTNLILGAIVVIAIGTLFLTFARNRQEQTSSTTNKPVTEGQKEDGLRSSTYTIKVGDNLWNISEKVYKSGYNWTQIARANNLENPGLIHAGNTLKLPKIDKKIASNTKSDAKTAMQEKTTANNAITDNKYTVKKGDNLWNIAVRAYGDGFRYVEIAKANNLTNPSLIHSNNVLEIPRK